MAVILGEKYRISILTHRLIRLEYQEDGIFEDRITKAVVNRTFDDIKVKSRSEDGYLYVETDSLLLKYDQKPFSTNGLEIKLKDFGTTWHYSIIYGNSDRNLLGTARTLDETDGRVMLEPGIFGRNGYAVLDDSISPVLDETNEYVNRNTDGLDIYFFGYGTDFYEGLRDFYRLCGKTPMIPRYALGNWWSRYYRYSEESYKEVVDKFEQEQIPLSVAVIDMDWHITEVDEKYGTGWTGYTWNKELFPDPGRFLKMLHDRGLAATLNLHPADGIRGFEDMYEDVAREMGIDPATEKPVEFDLSDSKFRDTYFKKVMNPMEDEGVDFWWIDWQQGTGKPDAVDPLFLLNHYHYVDQEKRNIRPMIFSRYAGPGSHRYPVGFSGDTISSWRSLNIQPFFTSTSSNIGYGWWSHDIGGHMQGDKNDERLVRWIEYGVFSPIMRLHSSNSAFMNKEPWEIDEPYRGVIRKYMRLRHALLPYLYTENYRAYKEDKPLIRPMYYDYHSFEASYHVPNEYGFGESLLVGAITEPADEKYRVASVNMLIPDGIWYDIFNGRIYKGAVKRKLYRKLDEIPVLLKAGGIVPTSLNDRENGTANPEGIGLYIGAGANGCYTMYEDDGTSMNYKKQQLVTTEYNVVWDENGAIEINIGKAEGILSLIPGERKYEIRIYGVDLVKDKFAVSVCGKEVLQDDQDIYFKYDDKRSILTVTLSKVISECGLELSVSGLEPGKNAYKEQVTDLLKRAWSDNCEKDAVFNALNSLGHDDFLNWLKEDNCSELLKDAVTELCM
ncbi:Alpha-glucosidase, glycosyl hydrolase family GH31 [Oribacterium sp. KHPX15]|uniref:glycoside hydrolase family 31 protein n=1 Tax=Oribacterium sp. KHPX15 TaxID=1855342 RepID=UPI00089C7234|nr:TIM-barrel domain-containing protein [Oribacterium sp. KHPX15]SEA00742.1 Alpha-glucosidase, glycosyl hydrolase family GH31 [Oribacterium sp. KHPX15]